MDRCIGCHNILPRTVDRCPVCGHDNAPAKAETIDVPTVPQGKDFLDAIGSKRQGVKKEPIISSPRSGRAPARIGHDGATPLYETKTTAEERESDFELPDLKQETRTVAAQSARLNSNIKMGRKKSHHVLVGVAFIVASAALGAGSVYGFQAAAVPDQIAMASVDVPTAPTDEPVEANGPIEGFDPAALVSIVEGGACGGPINAPGIVVEGGMIVSAIELTKGADTPAVNTGDITTTGDVLGLSNPNDISVLRPADRLEARLRIATSTTIRRGTRLAVVSVDGDAVTLSPAVVTGFQTRDASVHSFSIGTVFEEDEPVLTKTFPRGTLVVDANGDLLGIAGNTGDFVTAQRLAETVSRFQTNPVFPQPDCS